MAKRFIDTGLFRKPLVRSMEAPYKALFVYLFCECDHAGVWDVELDVAAMRIGLKLDEARALEKLGGAVVPIDGGAKWYLVDFVEFQYGELNPANRVHASVLARLSHLGIDRNKPLTSPLQGAKDKDKDKDKDMDMDMDKDKDKDKDSARVKVEVWPTFEDWWDAYGKKVDRPKCEAKWARLSQAEREQAYRHTEAYVAATPDVTYRRHPSTYLNNENWKDEDLTRQRTAATKRPEQLTHQEKLRMALEANAEHYRSHGPDAG